MVSYQRYIVQNILKKVFQLISVFAIIFSVMQISELNNELEGVSTRFLWMCMLYSLPSVLVTVLTFMFPLGAFWATSKYVENGEVNSISILGVPDRTLIGWVMQCGILGALLIWLAVSVVEPLAVANRSLMIENYTKRHIFSMIQPDTFQSQGRLMIYADDVDTSTHTLKNFFAAQLDKNNDWTVVSSKKLKETKSGSAELEDGQATRFSLLENKKKSISFSNASVFPYKLLNIDISINNIKVKSFTRLWERRQRPEELSRLCWMIGLPIICMIMMLMVSFTMFSQSRSRYSYSMISFIGVFSLSILSIIFIQRQTGRGYIHSIEYALILPNMFLLSLVFCYRYLQRFFR
ncbi:MAG: hypothetical protein CMF41_02920 [Legionellales bacterium]|nr:hypothetical protein [Legionellales bacterium]